jgi:hypothetical protein
MPMQDDRAHLDKRLGSPNLDHNHRDSHYRDRRGRMHHDAQRATVCLNVARMQVGHLGHGQQRQQDKTHDGHQRQSTCFGAAFPA